ncbi:MAG: YgeY family selenium metabolism-linked hydrolase [Anaerolineae bacterium]|jgi:putative selenium metabolism hydrolase|nr:YgeY family selenium metabolism-linked hydrolase [Anaerolineae bacterium]MBT7988468.1 YgeY family selenium metabolism-linked hydrolase [Anaerolineae bacterium]
MTIKKETLTLFAQKVIQTQSVTGNEKQVVEIILNEMRSLGFDRAWADANGSAIGIIEGKESGPTILLDAHCDTVGIAPGSTWTYDPFAAEIADGYIYGRGAADMKGALAAMVYAAANIDRSQLAGKIAISATVHEEVMEGVTLATVVEEVQPDFVIIGEATELNLNRGGRGRAEIHLEAIGKPAHSSNPELGVNAVHEMYKAINAIEGIKLENHPLLGPAIMALTDIISDPYPGYSVVPSRCRVTYDRRLLTGETQESVIEEIKSLSGLEGVDIKVYIAEGEHTTYTGSKLHAPKFFPAWEFPETHPFVEKALAGLQSVNLTPEIKAYRFCTNGAYCAGVANIPTIGFGPGAEGDAHVVNERISIEELFSTAKGYQGIISAVLGK